MQATYVQRLRLTFSKTGATRYIGHLDLARTMERALNRARIPMAYTQGFNRRPRMQFATALPLGFTSEHELADIWLMETLMPEQVQARLMAKMAPGITIRLIEDIPLSAPPLQTITAVSTYTVTLLDPVNKADLQERIDTLLAADSLIRIRKRVKKRKEYDLRPLIRSLALVETSISNGQILMRLGLGQGTTGRPDEVLSALGLDPLAAHIHRTAIILVDQEIQ